jgi:hypothetical protein
MCHCKLFIISNANARCELLYRATGFFIRKLANLLMNNCEVSEQASVKYKDQMLNNFFPYQVCIYVFLKSL